METASLGDTLGCLPHLADRAVETANTISDDLPRSRALAAIAEALAPSDPDRAVETANTIPNDHPRLAGIYGRTEIGSPTFDS